MLDGNMDANSMDSSPIPDANPADSSTAQAQQQGPEQATPQQAAPQVAPQGEDRFDQHPRWQERQREMEALRQQNAALSQIAARLTQQQQPVQQPANDPWEGLVNHPDPATALFHQRQRSIMQAERAAAQASIAPVAQALDYGRQQLAAVTTAAFYRENPDITPNSPEAVAIAEKVQMGYPLEDAKWIVMGPRYRQQAQSTSQRSQVQSQQQAQRRQVNPDTGPGIPATSGLAPAKRNFRDTLLAELDR